MGDDLQEETRTPSSVSSLQISVAITIAQAYLPVFSLTFVDASEASCLSVVLGLHYPRDMISLLCKLDSDVCVLLSQQA